MRHADWVGPLREAYQQATSYLTSVPGRPVGVRASVDDLRTALDGPLPEQPADPQAVIAALAAAIEPGLMTSNSGRYHGFVIGGQMANFAALAAARHFVLRAAGWDVEAHGLTGAPAVHALMGAERHHTIERAFRFLGPGTAALIAVDVDDQGRMRPDALRDELRGLTGPAIVCAQAGNINTGATLAQLPEGVSAEPGSASCNAAQLIPLVNGARANACCACAQRNVPANHGLACPGAAFAA